MEIYSKKEIQRERISYSIDQLTERGIDVHYQDKTEIRFMFDGNEIRFWPHKGWFQGKGLRPGRGIANLLKQLPNGYENG